MSKVTLAFGSFALGIATTFFALSGSPTLTSAQGRITPQQSIPPLAAGGGAGIPTVPPIAQHYTDFGVSATNPAYDVDGSECVRCVFNGPVLRYSGGNFQFTDFSFSGPVRVEFTGAARNTLLFLQFVQGLAAGRAPKQEMPNTSILKTATVKEPVKGSFGITK
ncbi:MAG: hypothetical protein AUG46_09245 [Acidobacteria bacterium 13_1_20CM_3_58_11]|nr:MAG: hypothetical protein AUG46_09245 [Acidobacteria bacterium 13_1_20CM_3_58_11]